MSRLRVPKRKRVEAPRIATLEDVHPSTLWGMCVRVFHKFHVEVFAPGRKRLYIVLLDQKGKKMAAIIEDNQVDRLEPLLVEGKAYYVWHMSAEPAQRNAEFMLADSPFVCRFTSVTELSDMTNVNEKCIPFFPLFMPIDKFWEHAFGSDTCVDVIGMALFVSGIGFEEDSFYNRSIPTINIVLMDGSYNIITLVVWDRLLTANICALMKSADERAIVVATILRPKSDDRSLHTTDFSRIYFNPDSAVVRELRQRINNELSGLPSA
ncbi:unnamed protein product [Urochloa decumbens]